MHASLLLVGLLAASPSPSEADLAFFESRVRPILVARCYECHSAQSGKAKGNLQLDSREAVSAGGDSGPIIDPADLNASLFVEAIGYATEGFQMPPAGKLPDAEIALLKEWVRRGAPFPAGATTSAAKRGIDLEAGRRHWAFQPLREQPLPKGIEVADPSNGSARIDAFVEAKRREHGLSASPEADARTLLRRAYSDLVGLPPSAEDVNRFAANISPSPSLPFSHSVRKEGESRRGREWEKEYETLVDQLLASSHYGERYGRYWLDMARYADVTESWREGSGRPWLYRDWVVRALNDDLPYDRFVRMQFAADLLPGAKPADNAALGFLGISPTYWKELKLDHSVIKLVVAEEWEERLDAVGQTFLGLTIGCARCHDHKFDPIAATDYYALAGVLAGIRQEDRPVVDAASVARVKQAHDEIKSLGEQLAALKKSKPADYDQQAADLERRINELKQTPHFDGAVVCGISDSAQLVLPDGEHRTKIEYRPGQAMQVSLHIRGNPSNLGPVVPRRFPVVLASDQRSTFTRGSGRLDLADAIVGDAQALAARVIVNRVWAWHFGRGLVATPSNFGTRGAPPSHPELLDDLAARFVADGWSLKQLHREIMLSKTYRQASARLRGSGDRGQESQQADPENMWLWRMSPRRLDVDAWRDAVLTATGELDLTLGGPPVDVESATEHRRTIYAQVKRRELSDMLRLNDFPDPVTHSSHREPTTTPLQQLYVMNGAWLAQRAAVLTTRVSRALPQASAEARIGQLYVWTFGRKPDEVEIATAREFIDGSIRNGTPADESWRRYAHALLMSTELQFVD